MKPLPLRRCAVVALISLGMMFAWGCASPEGITYIPDGGSYTADTLIQVLDSADPDDVAKISADEVGASRQEALADLRTHGDDAAALADTLTHQFPADVYAVPIEVHAATYEGTPAWIVVESWGKTGAELSSVRLWVFSTQDLELVTALSQQ